MATIEPPILVVYTDKNSGELRFDFHPPPGATVDNYAYLLVSVVKFLALGFRMSEKEVWNAIAEARLAESITIESGAPSR